MGSIAKIAGKFVDPEAVERNNFESTSPGERRRKCGYNDTIKFDETKDNFDLIDWSKGREDGS